VHEQLQRAAERTREAADAAADAAVRERLLDQAETFETLATADRGPDHGRIARHESILDEIADEAGTEVAGHLDEVVDHLHAYRETIEGV
jgi:type VI protein secretion system component VasF